MSDKQEMIQKMLKMQKEFLESERAGKFTAEGYYAPEAGGQYEGYMDEYNDLALKVMEIAHGERGSRR